MYTYAKVLVRINQVIKTTKEFLIFCTEIIHKNVDIVFQDNEIVYETIRRDDENLKVDLLEEQIYVPVNFH